MERGGSHLLLIDYASAHGTDCDAAFQLAAELLRWPENVKSAVSSSTVLPAISVTNKYFSVKVHIGVISADALTGGHAAHPSGSPVEHVLQHSASSVGTVFVVAESTDPHVLPWHSVPVSCLFRVVVLVAPPSPEREDMWYEACVANGFELVPHDIAYEVIPAGAESKGLLSGDAKGAARILQIMHNTMWPEMSRVTQRSHHNISTGGNSDSAPSNANTSSGSSSLPNVVSVIGVQSIKKVLFWLTETETDRRFFTSEWPPHLPTESVDREKKTTKTNENNMTSFHRGEKITIALANKYYTALVEMEAIHPALLQTSMMDLFVTQYSDRIPQLAVVVWPLTPDSSSHPNGMSELALPVLMDNIRRWGVGDVVVLARGPQSLSVAELHYCESLGTEVVFMSNKPENANYNQDNNENKNELVGVGVGDGTTGADRLAEILHMISWPQRRILSAAPITTPPAPVGNANQVLLWACAHTALEEEILLRSCLAECFAATPRQLDSVLSVSSTALDHVPAVTVNMRNKYFEANVLVYCHGGARSAITRSGLRTKEQMRSFAAVVLLTTPCACGVSGHPSSTLTAALTVCSASLPKCSSLPFVLDAEQRSHEDATRELCNEAERDVVRLLYVSGAEESDACLGACLDTLLLSTADAGASHSESESESESTASGGEFEPCVEPVEVVYGRGGGFARVREAMEQHMWPHRAMREVRPHTAPHAPKTPAPNDITKSNDITRPAEAMGNTEEEAHLPVATCALPPDYLVDPRTLRAQRVAALAGGKNGEAEIAAWADAMRQYGHRLPSAVRRRQAEALALCLGEHFSAGEEKRENGGVESHLLDGE